LVKDGLPETIESDLSMSIQRVGRKEIASLILAMLLITVVACQSHTSATVAEQWVPPYLQLQLSAGKAQVQSPDAPEWTVIDGNASLDVKETIQIIADAVEGAKFHLGDGSTLELMPGTIVDMQNPRTFPLLQVTLQEGGLLLIAQKPSYEIIAPTCSVTPLSLPVRLRVEIQGETTNLAIEEGAVTCELGTETLTLTKCQEMYTRVGESSEPIEFCDASATATVSAMTPSPTFDFRESDETPTATATPIPTYTPTLTREVVTQTPTATPTNTPPPPPQNKPTQPPPTQPPTNTPLPPTSTPLPPTPTPRSTPTQPPPTEPPPTEPPPTKPPPTEPPATEPPATEPTTESPVEPTPES